MRTSLAQTGRWLVGRGQVPEAELKDVPKEFTPAELERWSMTSETPVGRTVVQTGGQGGLWHGRATLAALRQGRGARYAVSPVPA